MRKLRKNAKALSPVVASIILIAVTVAVSIAVAAWMGALSIGFMETEQMSIVNAQFTDSTDGGLTGTTMTLSVRNTGTTDIVIVSATVNGDPATADANIGKNADGSVVVTADWEQGSTYQIRLLSSKGNYFPYNAVAP
jgi:flagellin-like protein